MRGRARSLAAGLLLAVSGGVAAEGSAPDVTPRRAAFPFKVKDPEALYFRADAAPRKTDIPDDKRAPDCKEGTKMERDSGMPARDAGRDAYPSFEDGEIHLPRAYPPEASFSEGDRERIRKGLRVARRYADINNAYADGYRAEGKFDPGMGVHVFNLAYLMSDEVSIDKPEFLTYSLNRKNGRFQLLQLGYMRRSGADGSGTKLFDAPEAKGHFHAFDICVRVEGNVLTYTNDAVCAGPGEVKVGPVWMMHFAVNLYNEKGLFAETFPYANHLSSHSLTYTFYGRLVDR